MAIEMCVLVGWLVGVGWGGLRRGEAEGETHTPTPRGARPNDQKIKARSAGK